MKTVGNKGVRLIILSMGLGLFAGCKHTSPEERYTWLEPKALPPTAAQTSPKAGMQAVKLERKIDPAWLQAPSDAFTLGPGDRLEIEIIGDPTSRTLTVVGPDGKIYFSLLSG